MLGPLKEEIGIHISRLINSSALTLTSNRRPPARQRMYSARRLFNNGARAGTALVQGEAEGDTHVPTVPVRDSRPKFWLYTQTAKYRN